MAVHVFCRATGKMFGFGNTNDQSDLLCLLFCRGFFRQDAKLKSDSIFQLGPLKGIDFVLRNSPTSRKYLIETMPGGVALLDYNNDGLLDIFLVNAGHVPRPDG